MAEIKLVIADDHPLIREGLRRILSLAPEITIVGEAENGEQAVELVRLTGADVVLMDINMPGMNGIAACKRIKAERPETKVIARSQNIFQSIGGRLNTEAVKATQQ
ncbi:MAG: response regulator [Desulfotomaculales bacterium]